MKWLANHTLRISLLRRLLCWYDDTQLFFQTLAAFNDTGEPTNRILCIKQHADAKRAIVLDRCNGKLSDTDDFYLSVGGTGVCLHESISVLLYTFSFAFVDIASNRFDMPHRLAAPNHLRITPESAALAK
jgi:hypothetical protein